MTGAGSLISGRIARPRGKRVRAVARGGGIPGDGYGAVVTSAPSVAPSSRNWTPTTPTLSAAVAETVTVPETVAPLAGAVMVTVAAASVSLETVTVTAALVVWLPAASRARAESVCGPFAAVALFQEIE